MNERGRDEEKEGQKHGRSRLSTLAGLIGMVALALALHLAESTAQSGGQTASTNPPLANPRQCYKDDDTVTLRGRVQAAPLELANGTTTKVWILVTDSPICIIEEDPSDDSRSRKRRSRFQIIGTAPTESAYVELAGTLTTGNFTQYYAESVALKVIRGKRLTAAAGSAAPSPSAQSKSENSLPPKNPNTERVTARGLSVVPGAIICPDYRTAEFMFDWYSAYWQDSFQDVITKGQSRLLRGPGTSEPNPKLYGCAFIPPGTPMELEPGNIVPIVSAQLPDGKTVRGATLHGMISR